MKASRNKLPKNAIPFMDDGEKIGRLQKEICKKEGKTLFIGVAVYNNARKTLEHGTTQIIKIDL